jgi:LEA14-like dessication related protein
MKMLKVLAIVLVVLIIIGGIVIGVAAYGYSNVNTQFSDVTGIQPEYATDLGSIIATLGQVALGNWLGAAKQFVSGVTIEGTIDFKNPNIIPLWIPTMEHKLYFGGENMGTTLKTPSMWLGARAQKSVPVRTTIPVDDLPAILVEYIYSGGSLDVSIESSIRMGTFSFSKTSKVAASINNSVESYKATVNTLSVNFDGWYVNGGGVSTTNSILQSR